MKVETIELILVCVIVSIQLLVFIQTFIQIGVFRRIIPKVTSLKITKVLVPIEDLERLTPKEILANIAKYKSASLNNEADNFQIEDLIHSDALTLFEESNSNSDVARTEVNIIESEVKTNHVFDSILFSVNNYLIRNRGAASDFNLIKDIVERNSNAVEEDINISIGVPLYLGLMGTMIGIVIGLFNMPDLGAETSDFGNGEAIKATGDMLDNGIATLIGGVKIAMIASFSGLMLTIINSGWVFKGSRSLSEARKNDFYTFVQIELLPIINQGLASTLESLQRNLLKFNHEFTINLRQLNGIFDSNTKAIKAQKELLDAIDKTKVAEMTRFNVKVLQQLDISVEKFEKFNKYMTNVTLFVENSQHIVNRTNELLARTDNFREIADNLDSKLNQSQQLLEFLSAHFKNLEDHKEFTSNAVADVGNAINETFQELKYHIQNSSEAMKKFTVDELELLKTALSESKTNLSNLEHLSTLKTDVSQFKNNSSSQSEILKKSIEDLNRNMARSIAILEGIEHSSFTYKAKGISTSIKNIFKSKK